MSVYLSKGDMCNWRRLTRKSLADSLEQSKTLDNIPASCLEINNPDPGGERTQDRPHTAVSSSTRPLPLSHNPRSSFPPLNARKSASCVSLHSRLCLSHLVLSSASWLAEHQWRILGNSSKMIHHLADLFHTHAFLCLWVYVWEKERSEKVGRWGGGV